jgi:hypothetical protein
MPTGIGVGPLVLTINSKVAGAIVVEQRAWMPW